MSIITLEVEDLPRAVDFYQNGLGFPRHGEGAEAAFFDLYGTWLGLCGREALAEVTQVASEGTGFSAFTTALNVHSEGEVDEIMKEALQAGAELLKRPQKTFWGGYSGYFEDPDGHIWEVAHNPSTWIGPRDDLGV